MIADFHFNVGRSRARDPGTGAAANLWQMAPLVVGLWIGGWICWIVIRKQTAMSHEVRLLAYQTTAFILVLLALVLIAAAVVAAEPGGVIAAAAITFVIAILVVLKIGPPEQHPVWRRVSARRRD